MYKIKKADYYLKMREPNCDDLVDLAETSDPTDLKLTKVGLVPIYTNYPQSLKFSNAGRILLPFNSNPYNLDTLTQIPDVDPYYQQLLFSPDEKHMAIHIWDGEERSTLKIYNFKTQTFILERDIFYTDRHNRYIPGWYCMANTPNSNEFAILSDKIYFFNWISGEITHELNYDMKFVGDICFTPSGKEVAIFSTRFQNGNIIDLGTGNVKKISMGSFNMGEEDVLHTACWNPNGKYLILANRHYICIYDGISLEPYRIFSNFKDEKDNYILCALWVSNSQILIADSGVLKIIDIHKSTISPLKLPPDYDWGYHSSLVMGSVDAEHGTMILQESNANSIVFRYIYEDLEWSPNDLIEKIINNDDSLCMDLAYPDLGKYADFILEKIEDVDNPLKMKFVNTITERFGIQISKDYKILR